MDVPIKVPSDIDVTDFTQQRDIAFVYPFDARGV
jgi:hypothetical protein